jgi:hypothetical protein
VWQSADPILGKYLPTGNHDRDRNLPGMGGIYSSLNLATFSYGHENPVTYKDPDGRLTIIVHGTGATGADYAQPGSGFNKAVSATFKETAVAFNWSGDNTIAARTAGATALAAMISKHKFAPGEKLNIVAHSHGGNVVKTYTGLSGARKIDTLVNLGTPQRDDFQINAGKVDEYLNVFSIHDFVQTHGGYTDIHNPITGNTTHVEVGPAGRQDPTALNVEASTVTVPGRLYGTREMNVGHSDLHTVPVWTQKIAPLLQDY